MIVYTISQKGELSQQIFWEITFMIKLGYYEFTYRRF